MKTTSFHITLLVLVAFVPSTAFGQGLTLLGSGGGFSSVGDLHLAYSLGEPVIAYEQNTSTWLTQGFQQPGHVDLMVSIDGEATHLPIHVYPNPATTSLTLAGLQPGDCHSLTFTNLLGQQALSISAPVDLSNINIESLQPGWYILTMQCHETQYRSTSIIKL